MSEDRVPSRNNSDSDSQQQSGGGDGASPSQIGGNPAADIEPRRSQNSEKNLVGI